MTNKRVSVQRTIATDAATIFAVLADPAAHADFDGSGTVTSSTRSNPHQLTLGTKFGMRMKLGIPYSIRSTVKEFEQDRLIAWAHMGGHRWRYELEPAQGGTLVTETFDWSTAVAPICIEIVGWPKRHLPAMHETLRRLDGLVSDGGDGAAS